MKNFGMTSRVGCHGGQSHGCDQNTNKPGAF